MLATSARRAEAAHLPVEQRAGGEQRAPVWQAEKLVVAARPAAAPAEARCRGRRLRARKVLPGAEERLPAGAEACAANRPVLEWQTFGAGQERLEI